MSFSIKNIQFDYNSVVIISYLLLSLLAWILNTITHGKANKYFFSSYRSSLINPLTYLRLFTHSIGHANWDHFVHNFIYILLIGPMIEEKYGSINLIIMYSICGASGNVYMLIVLSSFANISEGKIPLTVLLILIFYVISEIKNKVIKKHDNAYHDGHILGALCGILFGIYFLNHNSLLDILSSLVNIF